MPRHKPLRLVRASAGSGKTFSLTAHYLILLLSGPGKYREILAVTFTNKATAEMKERILGALEELAISGFERSKFSSILKEGYPELSDLEMRVKASVIYSSILHDYSRFSVSTIDGFVQQLIRSFAFELNLDSGYKLEMNQEKVKDELVKALNIHLESDPELLEWVTTLAIDRINDGKDWDYQRALKDLANEIFKERYYPFQEAMLAMGDEQGKEFNSLREIVSSGIDEFRKTALEKTKDIKRIFDTSGTLPDELNQKSRNPLLKLEKILNEDFSHISSLARLVDDFDQWPHGSLKDNSAIRQLYKDINPHLKGLIEFFNAGSEQYETYLAINKNSSYLRLMQGMADLLKNYRSENRTLLISDAQQLLKGITGSDVENPSFIWEKTGNKYKHFLFDEFQDTSTFQWENFLPLIKNAISGFGGERAEHLVVGDVKQSIYRWRNGDWRILHSKVKKDLSTTEDNVSEENLEFNRRSSENIIRFNNFLYQKLPVIFQQQLNNIFAETGPSHLLEAWEENSRLIEKAYEGSTQRITEDTLPGGKVEIKFFSRDDETDEEDAAAAAYTIEKLITLLNGGVSMRDIGILVRTNSEAEEIVECIFQKTNQDRLTRAAGKTFQVISGEALKIVNNPAVQLLLGTFRILAVHEPESGIYKAECARLWQQIRFPEREEIGLNSKDWMDLAREHISGLADILPAALCSDFNTFRKLPVNELAEKLIHIYQLGGEASANQIPFLLAFRDQVAVFSSGGDQGIGAFLDWWDTEGSNKALPSAESQDAVRVMTVHKSKGLEFKAVIVPFINWKLNVSSGGFNKRLLWVDAKLAGFEKFNSLPVDYNKDLASTVFASNYFEEMMLNYMDVINTLYVATTRAKDYLCLICPKTPLLKNPSTSGPPNDLQAILSQLLNSGDTGDLEFISEDNNFLFGEIPVLLVKPIPVEQAQLMIHTYQVNGQLAERFKRNNQTQESWFNARQRKGVVLHQLLETLSGLDDLGKLLTEKVQEGLIREAEKDELRQAVADVLMQEEISHWFNTAKSIISEKDMILDSGIVKRPDKLFILEDRAILLDFKFGTEHNKYIADIKLYQENLMKMGEFKVVDAYLWYAQDRKLQKV